MATLLTRNSRDAGSRRDRLIAYLDDAIRVPWQWGVCDCAMIAGNWINAEIGKDVAARFRAGYRDHEEARALVKRKGGFVPMIGAIFDGAGFERVHDPLTGDVGLIDVPMIYRDTMPVVGGIIAIRLDDLWVARSRDGMVAQPFPHHHAWRLP